MSDYPQYFKFVLWMLTSSLKTFSIHSTGYKMIERFFLSRLLNNNTYNPFFGVSSINQTITDDVHHKGVHLVDKFNSKTHFNRN